VLFQATSHFDFSIMYCRGLVTLHWLRVRAGLSKGDLCGLDGQSVSVAHWLASQSSRSCWSEHTSSSHMKDIWKLQRHSLVKEWCCRLVWHLISCERRFNTCFNDCY